MSYIRKKVFSNNLLKNLEPVRNIHNSVKLRNDKVPEEALPINTIEKYYNTHLQPKGIIYDKRPFRMNLVAGKKYAWCTCGRSKSQPLCDGTHKIPSLNETLKPICFMVEETKEYWLCNCKQSERRPFCDGTHKNESIQSMRYFKT